MRLVIAILAAALLSVPATAQRVQSEKQPAASKNKQQTQTKQKGAKQAQAMSFVKKVAVANMYEVEAGRLAQERAQRDDVKQLAQTIVAAHEKAGEDLKNALGEDANLLPTALDSKYSRLLDQLTRASGQQLDRLFIQQQLRAHMEAIALVRSYARRGDNPQLKQLAQDMLPVLEHHLQTMRELQSGRAVAAKGKGAGSSATGGGSGTGGSRK